MSYIEHGFTFTEGQLNALQKAYNVKIGHSLRLDVSQLSGNHKIEHNTNATKKDK